MGAGILGVPLFYKSYGLILSTFIIGLFSTVTVYSVSCLLYCNRITKKSGYSIFAKICYGNLGSLLVKTAIIVNNFGLTCAYFRIFGDVTSGVVKAFMTKDSNNFFADNWHNWFYIICVALIMTMFIFKDKMDSLKVSILKAYYNDLLYNTIILN